RVWEAACPIPPVMQCPLWSQDWGVTGLAFEMQEGGSEVRHDAPNDSLSALLQSGLPASPCRAQWAYERASALSLFELRCLVRRDAGHAALPAADSTSS